MATSYPRRLDLASVADEHARFVALAANLCADLFDAGGFHISVPYRPAEVVVRGDTMKAGSLIAAAELRELLGKSPQGRQALRDLGFEPVLQHVEGP